MRLVDESLGFLPAASAEDFRRDAASDYTVFGLLFVAVAIGSLVGNAAVALGDGRSRKVPTVVGAAVLSVSLVAFAAAQGPAALLVASLVAGAGSTALVAGAELAVAAAVVHDPGGPSLERLLATQNLGGVVGDLAAPTALVGLRAAGVDWRWVFVGAAVLAAGYAVVLARTAFPPPTARPDEGTTGDGAETGADAVAEAAVDGSGAGNEPGPVRWVAVAAVAGIGLVTVPLDEAYLGLVLAQLERGRGLADWEAAALAVPFVLGGFLTFTLLPERIARTPFPRLVVGAGIGLSAVTAAVAVAPTGLLLVLGLAHSVILDALWLGQQAMVLRARPGQEGLARLVVEAGDAVGFGLVAVLGLVAERSGLVTAILASAAVPLVLVVVGVVLGAIAQRPQ